MLIKHYFFQKAKEFLKKNKYNFKIFNKQMILMLLNYAWGKPDDKNKFKLTQNVFSKYPKDHESISFHAYVNQNFQLINDSVENEKIE